MQGLLEPDQHILTVLFAIELDELLGSKILVILQGDNTRMDKINGELNIAIHGNTAMPSVIIMWNNGAFHNSYP
jgi:hypothetical protein